MQLCPKHVSDSTSYVSQRTRYAANTGFDTELLAKGAFVLFILQSLLTKFSEIVGCGFLVAPCCCKERLYFSLCHVLRPVVCLSVHLQKNFPTFTFLVFLHVSCHPECSKKFSPQIFFHPKIFLVKQGATQCCQAFLVCSNN